MNIETWFLVSILPLAIAPGALASKQSDTVDLAVTAIEHGDAFGDAIWHGFGSLGKQFAVVDDKHETVYCAKNAPGFEELSASPIDGCRAFRRKRIFPPRMQASLNLTGPVETVLVSSPETLGQSDPLWILLFLHERFHQWQSTLPDYHQRVSDLELSGGDETGMWMLNYAFPYEDPNTITDFQQLGMLLAETIDAVHSQGLGVDSVRDLVGRYRRQRVQVFAKLDDGARRYLEFQLWKEGTARWTEMALADALANSNQRLAGKFAELRTQTFERMIGVLRDMRLNERQRGIVYELGAGELMLLNALNEDWRKDYGKGALELDRLFSRFE